jgi:large subunit ribosomal protein L18
LGSIRLCVHRTNSHIYAQIIDATGGQVIASASSLEKGFKDQCKSGSNVSAAKLVGQLVAEKAKQAGIEKGFF